MQEHLSKAERKAHKAKRKKEKQARKNSADRPLLANNHEVTVLCVKFGNKYGNAYVKTLSNMVSRHLTIPYEFVCLTDDPKPIEGVRKIIQRNAGYTKGWWHKVHMFDPSLNLSGRILYLDLDVIVCNNIDKLVQSFKNEFVGIRDFNRKFHPSWKKLNSSVMSWTHGNHSYIYQDFIKNTNGAMRLHGDQDWIWKQANKEIKFFPDDWIQSYKWEVRNKQDLIVKQGKRNFKNVDNKVRPKKDCCITVFHGDPNPEDVQDQFVIDNWH